MSNDKAINEVMDELKSAGVKGRDLESVMKSIQKYAESYTKSVIADMEKQEEEDKADVKKTEKKKDKSIVEMARSKRLI